jgi:GH15 family glucan-1,4-alpha-glucosidase
LADTYTVQGRYREADSLFRRLLDLRNDVGLLAEEYDPSAKRLVGNFPQALSHLALVNTAYTLANAAGPAQHRQRTGRHTSTKKNPGEA